MDLYTVSSHVHVGFLFKCAKILFRRNLEYEPSVVLTIAFEFFILKRLICSCVFVSGSFEFGFLFNIHIYLYFFIFLLLQNDTRWRTINKCLSLTIYIFIFIFLSLFSRISYLNWDQVALVNKQVSEVCQPPSFCSLTVSFSGIFRHPLLLLSLKQGPDLFRGAVII